MEFKILIFYHDEDSLTSYLHQFHLCQMHPSLISSEHRVYRGDHCEIVCIKGLSENFIIRRRAHIIAVQEDLTWGVSWPFILSSTLDPLRLTPIPVQIFDGISAENVSET